MISFIGETLEDENIGILKRENSVYTYWPS